jgi:ABC-2 type transport system permease protein
MNVWTICRRELSSYFRSPIAYGVMTIFALVAGFFFYLATLAFVQQSVQSAMMGQSVPMNVNEYVVGPVLGNLSVIFLFLVPLITMRLFAEERRSGTMELLVTSPIRDIEIILGKWLAALVLFAALISISLVNMLTLFAYGTPDWHPMAVAFLGLLLQGGCILSIGMFASSLTKNQIVAGAVGFGICLLLFVLDWVSQFENSPLFQVLGYLGFATHYQSFARGIIDSKDVVYYISMIVLGLFLTARSMESMRWRA